jgi:hypothetical protein
VTKYRIVEYVNCFGGKTYKIENKILCFWVPTYWGYERRFNSLEEAEVHIKMLKSEDYKKNGVHEV